MPTPSVQNLTQLPENDPIGFDDCLFEFRMQAGLVDKTCYIMNRNRPNEGACLSGRV